MSSPPGPVPSESCACENCGHDMVGAYCAACGQKAAPFRRPIRHLGREVVEDYFGFDGKLWRTIGPLLARPGFLTCEYLDGRRNQYVRPVRLYLTASIVLFFLLSVLPEGGFLSGAVQVNDESEAAADSLQPNAALAEIEEEITELDVTRASLVATRDSLRVVVTGGAADRDGTADREAAGVDSTGASAFWEGFGAVMEAKGSRIGEMGEEGAKQWFVDMFTSSMPKAMFVLLPLFAFFLKLLYARRERYYGEHLVFALHTHAFAFFAFTALALLLTATGDLEALSRGPRVVAGSAVLLLLLSVPAYVLLALKRVYGQGWNKTILKWAVLMSAYNVALSVGMAGVIVLAFLLL